MYNMTNQLEMYISVFGHNLDIRLSFLAGHQWLTRVILAILEAEIRRMLVWGQPRQIVQETPISKITRAKWTGGVAQAIELLLCKYEVLSSNPSPKNNRKRWVLLTNPNIHPI
jgi:hypothetical protein